jgi:uncharacterized membrane protein (GlpM family)
VYRVLRGKAFYISLILFVLVVVPPLLTGEKANVISFTVNDESMLPTAEVPVALTAASAPLLVMAQFQPLIVFALILVYVISAADFNSGAIQNAIAAGLSRPGLYFAKLFLSFVFIELFALIAMAVGIVVGWFVGGLGTVSEALVFSGLRAFGIQSLMMFTLASVGTAIIFITRKGAALNAIYLLLFLGGSIVLFSASGALGTNLMGYDFVPNMALAANIDVLPREQVTEMFTTIVVYLGLSMALGLASFRRATLK